MKNKTAVPTLKKLKTILKSMEKVGNSYRTLNFHQYHEEIKLLIAVKRGKRNRTYNRTHITFQS